MKTVAIQDPRFPLWARAKDGTGTKGFTHRCDANGITACGMRLPDREVRFFNGERRCFQCVKLGKSTPARTKLKYIL